MENPFDQFRKQLKASGFSETAPRTAVFEALYKNGHEPMTMAQLVKITEPQADRASIYRAVKLLESINIINRLTIGWKYKLELSDDFHGHHHHITCVVCGASHATHDDDDFEDTLRELALRHGYTLTDHQLEMRGICRACLNKK